MRLVSPLKYAFAVARVRALENSLIGGEAFRQAAESETADALRIFSERGRYGDGLLHAGNSGELEAALSEAKRSLLALIDDLLLDRWLLPLLEPGSLEDVVKLPDGRPGPFLEDYRKHVIDLNNIKTFLRLRAVGEPPVRLAEHLIGEGFLEKETFLHHYADDDLASWIRSLDRAEKRGVRIPYGRFLREGIKEVEESRSFATLETRSHDFLIGVLRPAKTIVFGPEPLMAYYWARINEMRLIRMVILSKMNQVPVDRIKARLGDVYA